MKFQKKILNIFQNKTPPEFEEFVKHVSGQVFRMKEWQNQVGKLEKVGEMTDDDYLMESNIIHYDNAKNDPMSFTKHVEQTLNELRQVFNFIKNILNNF